MKSAYEDHLEVERAYRRSCVEAGNECATARGAAALFGVSEGSIHEAKRDGRLHPVFVLHLRDTPVYTLAALREYFAGRAAPDQRLLDKMRGHGPTCFVEGAGGWVLLTERPGLRTWDEGDA